jgi:hypothetical protein
MATLATLQAELQRWIPNMANADAVAFINEAYQDLSDELPLNRGTLTFASVANQYQYDFTPGTVAVNPGALSVKQITKAVWDDAVAKTPITKFVGYPRFELDYPGWYTETSSEPKMIVKYSGVLYWFFPAPLLVKNIKLWVDWSMVPLALSTDPPVGLIDPYASVLPMRAALKYAKQYDRADIIPVVSTLHTALYEKLVISYEDTMPIHHDQRHFNYR